MRHGTCNSCGSATVRAGQNVVQLGEHLPAVLRPHREPGTRGAFAPYSTEGLWTFVCTSCGYLEFHLVDQGALAFVAQNWLDVPAQHPPPA